MTRPPASRRYDASSRRAQAQATRERIVRVATRLFLAHGYAATSMGQIAAEAGVSTPTVFAAYRGKVNLLKQAIDTAIVGDTAAVALNDRPAMRDVHDAPTSTEALRRYAAVIVDVAARAYPIYAVAHAAADADPQIAALVADLDQQRLTGATHIATTVADRLGNTDPRHVAYLRDTIWTLNSPLLYGLLVHQRGWTVHAYRDWIATALIALTTPTPTVKV
ncbi:TetR/AcrR family transcriptional regulator [Phytohabitans sp. LJ34]|uniref:TetR/AcrR family transcriptional regulator n=1 Tax=Phytohabitans sp. LJ34 TaxID=3452217 RepID=UPI003F8ADE6D